MMKQCPECGRKVSAVDMQGGLCPFCRLDREMKAAESSGSMIALLAMAAMVGLVALAASILPH